MEIRTRTNEKLQYAIGSIRSENRRSIFFLEAAPIPFEKDDDFQIDFIVAATVCGFHNQRISIRKSLLEFKSANVRS